MGWCEVDNPLAKSDHLRAMGLLCSLADISSWDPVHPAACHKLDISFIPPGPETAKCVGGRWTKHHALSIWPAQTPIGIWWMGLLVNRHFTSGGAFCPATSAPLSKRWI